MKILKKIKSPDMKIVDFRKINKKNRFSERQIADAVMESIFEADIQNNPFGEADDSLDFQIESLNPKNELIIEKMISDLLSTSDEPLKAAEQTILFYNKKGKLESILTMETYNEILSLGLENNNVNIQDTVWLCSLMEQNNIFKNNSEVFYSLENEMEVFCHYEDVTN